MIPFIQSIRTLRFPITLPQHRNAAAIRAPKVSRGASGFHLKLKHELLFHLGYKLPDNPSHLIHQYSHPLHHRPKIGVHMLHWNKLIDLVCTCLGEPLVVVEALELKLGNN